MSAVDRSQLIFEDSNEELSISSPIIIKNPLESSEEKGEDVDTNTQNDEDGTILSQDQNTPVDNDNDDSGEGGDDVTPKPNVDEEDQNKDEVKSNEKELDEGVTDKEEQQEEIHKTKFERKSQILIIETCDNECEYSYI